MNLTDLDNLIRYISEIHSDTASRWETSGYFKGINLAKTCVIDVMDTSRHPEYLEYIFCHRSFLCDSTIEYGLEFAARGCESRVKTQNSTESKLAYYMKNDRETGRGSLGGEVPLKKCLNDLFGIRCFVSDSGCRLCDIIEYVESRSGGLKVLDSSKDDYKGVHIYFQKNNRAFPWELQIWRTEDIAGNKRSHGLYKQEYTKWESESRKERS